MRKRAGNGLFPAAVVGAWLLIIGGEALLAGPSPANAPGAETAPPAALEAWMPEDVIGYVKLSGVGAKLEEFLGSDFRRDLESIDVVRAALAQEPWQKFQEKLQAFRTATGKEPLQVFRDLLGREALVGVRLTFAPEVLVITRTAGEAELEAALRALRDAIGKEVGAAIEPSRTTYGDRAIETYDKLSITRFGPILAASNSQPFLHKAIDLAAGKSAASVQSSSIFKKAAGAASKDATLILCARPQYIPNFKIPDKADNSLASLLFSGWLGALEKSELLTAALRIDEGKVGLDLASILGDGGLPEKYGSLFPKVAPDVLLGRLEKRGLLAVAQLHRDLHKWWERREDLLLPRAVGELLEFSQVMSAVFQGRNFQDEVLPEFGERILLVARNQEYADLGRRPKPAIPGFALIFELRKAQEFGDGLIGGFQSLISIINLDRAQKKKEGGMSMVQKTVEHAGVEFHTVNMNLPKEAQPGMAYNFKPSLCIVGSRVVISSSLELGKVIAEEIAGAGASASAAPAAPAADRIVIDAAAVRSLVEENRDLLVADSMMKKGKSKEQADLEIKTVLEVLKRLRGLRLESKMDGDIVKLGLELRTGLEQPAGASGPADAGTKPAAATKKASL